MASHLGSMNETYNNVNNKYSTAQFLYILKVDPIAKYNKFNNMNFLYVHITCTNNSSLLFTVEVKINYRCRY